MHTRPKGVLSTVRWSLMLTAFSVAGCDGGSADAKRIFVTSLGYTGDRTTAGGAATGWQGADALCDLAAAGAALGGAWVAWASDSGTNAIDRIMDVGPWYFVDGATLVFNNKANLATSPVV